MPPAKPSSYKVVLVGEFGVGKTSLIFTFAERNFSFDYWLEIKPYDEYERKIKYKGKLYNLTFFDAPSSEDYDKLRPLTYMSPKTDCFLLCYSIDNRDSFNKIKSKWAPEVRQFLNDTPIILVGTKLDLGEIDSEKFISKHEAEMLGKEIDAFSTIECSAKSKKNLDELLEQAVKAIEYSKPKRACTMNIFNKKSCCLS